MLPDSNLTASISDLSDALDSGLQLARGNSMIISANIYYPYTSAHFQALQDVAANYGYTFVGLDTCIGDQPADIYQNATWAIGDGFCYIAQENCTNSPADCGACIDTAADRSATNALSSLFTLSTLTSNYQAIAIASVAVVAGSSIAITLTAKVASGILHGIRAVLRK